MSLRDLTTRVRKTDETSAPIELASPRQATFIDAGCELTGRLYFREGVHIDGHVEGELSAEKDVEIGPSGSVHANLRCASVVIRGEVRGDIEAARKITFHKGARVDGEMKAASIVIEEGARFRGTIVIGADAPEPAAPQLPATSS